MGALAGPAAATFGAKGLIGSGFGSGISGMFGSAGGVGGTGFNDQSGANLYNPVNADQMRESYAGSQASMEAQKNLLGAIQAQQGLQNQSNVYNQFQNIAAGQGPNPAQAMLDKATSQNVANQAALMAGQRGAGANVGMIARQAAMQGSNAQQQAASDSAVMQANQQLSALNNAGSMAGQMATNQIGQTNANTSAQQAQQQALMNAQNAFNSAQVGSQSSVNSGNAALAGKRMDQQAGMIGGIMNGVGSAFGMAEGGEVPQSAYPGQSKFGQFLHSMNNPAQAAPAPAAAQLTSDQQLKAGTSKAASGLMKALSSRGGGAAAAMASGGVVPAMVSPGEKYLSPQAVEAVKRGANPMSVGETIPGKPKVGGAKNSYANDTVPKNLQEGGVVIPRSDTKSKNPERASSEFVQRVLAKRVARG